MIDMKKLNLLSTVYAYDNSSGWKTDENGAIVLKDGNPVYLDSSGREMVVQSDTISRLNGEAKTHREAKEALEAKLKSFEGIDAAAARDALEKLKKIDQKNLIDSGEVDKLKAQIQNEFLKQIEEKDRLISNIQSEKDSMQVNGIFAMSDFVREEIAVPRDMFEATFKNNFKVENGKVVAYDRAGNMLMSKERVGEAATTEEALRLLVASHPQKDSILKADIGRGTGSNGSGGNRGTGRTMKRSEFMSYPPSKQAEIASKVSAGEMQLTD